MEHIIRNVIVYLCAVVAGTLMLGVMSLGLGEANVGEVLGTALYALAVAVLASPIAIVVLVGLEILASRTGSRAARIGAFGLLVVLGAAWWVSERAGDASDLGYVALLLLTGVGFLHLIRLPDVAIRADSDDG